MNQMTTLLRRELWEHRAIYAVPTVFGGLFVIAAVLGLFGLVNVTVDGEFGPRSLAELIDQVEPGHWRPGLEVLFASVSATLQMVMAAVIFFYLVDALYAERRDRSILFWKSLPVTDYKVVGSKFVTAMLVIPAVTTGIFMATVLLLWLIGGLTALFAGSGEALAAGPGALFRSTLGTVYAMAVQSLWYAPVYAWLLLASAYARRAPLLWTILPPVGVIVAEKILLGTSRFAEMLGWALVGCFDLAFDNVDGGAGWQPGAQGFTGFPTVFDFLTPGRFFSSTALWAGLVVAAVFLAGAVWLRRWRDEA